MTSDTITTLRQRLQQLPRAARWAVYGAGTLLVLYIYSSLVLPTAASWSESADRIQAALAASGSEETITQRIEALQPVIVAIGAVETPQGEADSSEALKHAVNEIFKGHSVTNYSFQTSSPTKLPQSSLRGIVGPNEQAEHLDARVDFDATAEEAAAIIAELEADPAIEKISSLRMVKMGGADRKLSVKLTLEAWVVSRASSSAFGSAGGVRR